MSSNIWQIGNDINAEKFCEMAKSGYYLTDGGFNRVGLFGSEVSAVKQLTKACQEMIDAYDEVLKDQNEYYMELDSQMDELSDFQKEQDDKIQKLLKEIKALEKKEEDGNITEEEKQELADKKGEYDKLTGDTKTAVNDKNNKLEETKSKQNEKYRSKIKIAENYGETAVEKGQPLAETEQRGGFWNRLTGKTRRAREKKEVGEKAVETGNNLLECVAESTALDNDFTTKLKNKK